MRKKLLMACLLVGGSVLYANAQTQLVNGNMETWDNVGSSNEEPQQWNSFKTADCTLGLLCGSAQNKQVERSNDIRPGSSGTYSARIYSTNPIGSTIANGNLTTGIIRIGNISPANSNNYNYTNTANANNRMPLTAKPDSIVFWARFQPGNNSTTNTARMRATIHDNTNYRDPGGNNVNEVGRAEINYTRTHDGTNYVWQRFSIPFDYTQGSAPTPSYILITFTTNNNPGGGANNDQVWIDDVELVYVPVTTTPNVTQLVYNISATTGSAISIPFTKTGTFQAGNIFTAQLSDATGSFATPTTLGTLTSTAAGTISGNIPAGTPSGTGYQVRVIASSPYQTANVNASNITINLVNNSIAPTATQTIVAGVDGNTLTVSETVTATSREWKYATVSGGPYTNFSPAQSSANYIPNFTNAGTYYIVCETSVGSLTARSNEVTVNVIKNQITPAGSQSLLIGNAGATLTVTETPAATSREWLYSNTAGGPYQSFAPTETGITYQPVFNTAGTYYIVTKSVISGIDVTSNEVTISVGNLNIITGTVTGSPFEFSVSAPSASVNVPFTVSSTFNAGNIFTAQLSDASGSFTAPTNIGTLTSTTDGTINTTIPASTPAGNGYLIRVVSSDPVVSGSDNGTALVIDQFNNNITPGAAQSFIHTANGNTLTVHESQNATREWRTSTVAGGPYTAISGQAGNTYIPSFSSLGTFYVVAASTNQYDDEVISNEVAITVTNGNTLATSAISGSPFYVSPSANNQVTVNFTSDVIFDSGNTFTAELSNASGSFIVPVNIGSITSTTPGTISATLPNSVLDGDNYRIRVKSSSPAIIGTNNGTDIELVNFAVSISPADTQYVAVGTQTSPINVVSTHPNISVEWKYRTPFIGDYQPFNPLVTGTTFAHSFNSESTFIVAAQVINNWGDTLVSDPAVIKVTNNNAGINESNMNGVKAFMDGNQFILDITNSTSFVNPNIELVNMSGQVVYQKQLKGKSTHVMPLSLASGIYTYRISENGNYVAGKIPVL
jgi:hypothetical protein